MNIIQVGFGRYPVPYVTKKATGGDNSLFYLSNALGSIEECNVGFIDLKSKIHKKVKTNFKYYEVLNLNIITIKSAGLIQNIFHSVKIIIFAFLSAIKVFSIDLKEGVDIVHTHNQFVITFIYLIKKLFNRKYKIVYTTHSVVFMFPKIPLLYGPLEKFALKCADHIIAHTDTVKKSLVNCHKVPKEKVSQIYYGIEVEVMREYVGTHNKRRIYETDKVIIYVSAIARRKNQLGLLKSLYEVVKKFPDVKCLIVGGVEDKSYLLELKKFVDKNNMSVNVIFTGAVSRKELYQLYADATISVILSKFETQGLMLIESMAFNLPVVVSNIGPFVDVVGKENKYAIVVEADNSKMVSDAIIKLLSEPKIGQQLVSNSQQLIKEFSWEKIAQKTFDVYKRIVD